MTMTNETQYNNFKIEYTLNELAELYKVILLFSGIPCDKTQVKNMTEQFKKDMRRHKSMHSNYPMTNHLLDIWQNRASLEYNKLGD